MFCFADRYINIHLLEATTYLQVQKWGVKSIKSA